MYLYLVYQRIFRLITYIMYSVLTSIKQLKFKKTTSFDVKYIIGDRVVLKYDSFPKWPLIIYFQHIHLRQTDRNTWKYNKECFINFIKILGTVFKQNKNFYIRSSISLA